jgi:hypothetical protein
MCVLTLTFGYVGKTARCGMIHELCRFRTLLRDSVFYRAFGVVKISVVLKIYTYTMILS